MEHFDVLIVGAGLSGIGAGVHLSRECPGRSFAILEARGAIGGTWDLFRYPGIRSDSDMYTLGYDFKPWTEAKAIADGPSILNYIRETARENGIDRHIRLGHKVVAADWSSDTARWTLTIALADGGQTQLSCNLLYSCSGYYSYDEGHRPEFAGEADFAGRIVHPQFWPDDLDYAGKRVAVIGSGATAVTLVPEMAKRAAKVTMLQRSPTYVVSRPANDALADSLRKWLPAKLAYALVRLKNISLTAWIYDLSRRKPEAVKAHIVGQVKAELGPDFDVGTHFTPSYNPWDQRICLVPDADLFAAIREGRAEVVTDRIERFTADGIALASGQELPVDIIVTATGLKLNALGGVALRVDGVPVELGKTLAYKGIMYGGVPNLVSSFGYVNASWTLRSDLIAHWTARLLNHLAATGADYAVARPAPDVVPDALSVQLASGYVQRAADLLPKQGNKAPWKVKPNYFFDLALLRFGRIDDGTLSFGRATGATAAPARAAAEMVAEREAA